MQEINGEKEDHVLGGRNTECARVLGTWKKRQQR